MKVKTKKPSKSKLIKKADTIHSLNVRERDKYCLKCDSPKNLQCAHIINRDNMVHRWDMRSAITLCYKCHIHWWHAKPLEAADWLKETYPEKYAYYWEHKNDSLKFPIDFEELFKSLKEALSEMQSSS